MKQSMQELEEEIIADLEELSDVLSQFTYIVECGKEAAVFPEEFRKDEYLIPECQVKTWMASVWENGILKFYADSEAAIIRGALSLLAEIYDGRTRDEIGRFSCTLIENEMFAVHFTQQQRTGIKVILNRLLKEAQI